MFNQPIRTILVQPSYTFKGQHTRIHLGCAFSEALTRLPGYYSNARVFNEQALDIFIQPALAVEAMPVMFGAVYNASVFHSWSAGSFGSKNVGTYNAYYQLPLYMFLRFTFSPEVKKKMPHHLLK